MVPLFLTFPPVDKKWTPLQFATSLTDETAMELLLRYHADTDAYMDGRYVFLDE